MNMEHWWSDSDSRTRGIGRKTCTSATLSTKMSRALSTDRDRALAVSSGRLTARAMVRPHGFCSSLFPSVSCSLFLCPWALLEFYWCPRHRQTKLRVVNAVLADCLQILLLA
jgi:hypothetical protein